MKLISKVYDKYPDDKLVLSFIENNLFFVDVDTVMVENTTANISSLYFYLFGEEYKGAFNAINWDFTDKKIANNLFDELSQTPFTELYNSFDYVIGNPPTIKHLILRR